MQKYQMLIRIGDEWVPISYCNNNLQNIKRRALKYQQILGEVKLAIYNKVVKNIVCII